jgi:bacteriorhodopsin
MHMTVQVESKIESSFLYRVLKFDGLFAVLSGIVLVLGASAIASLFDLENQIAFVVVGVLVLGYGASLLLLIKQGSDNRKIALAAITLNMSWVVLSYLGLLLGWFPVNAAGKWTIALVAEAVLVFAVLEFIGLRRQQ